VINHRSSLFLKNPGSTEEIEMNHHTLDILGELHKNVRSEMVIKAISPLDILNKQDSKPKKESLFKNMN
jgi:hypothetical protein